MPMMTNRANVRPPSAGSYSPTRQSKNLHSHSRVITVRLLGPRADRMPADDGEANGADLLTAVVSAFMALLDAPCHIANA